MTFYSTYFFNNNRTIVVDMMGQNIDLCEAFTVTDIVYNINTCESKLIVEIFHGNGSSAKVELPRQQAASNPLPALTKAGLSIANVQVYVVTISEILMDLEKSAPVKYVHARLGFQNIDGVTVFLSAETATPIGVSKYSEYDKLQPCGTFADWRSGILPFAKDKPEFLLGLAMCASAPVAYLLDTAGMMDGSALFALIGASSQSKTTMLKASASIFGVPSQYGLIDTMLRTEGHFIEYLMRLDGFPCLIDEVSICSFDFTSLIYSLCMNREKGRCKSDGTPKPVRLRKSTSITFTGEKSMLAQSNGNSGLFARLLEFDFVWTRDAAASDRLSKLVSEQHGTAGPIFIDFLQSIDTPTLTTMYSANIDSIKKYITPKNGVEERIVKKLALLRLTIEIMSAAWDISVDFVAIDNVLNIAFSQNAPKADKIEETYEALKQYIISHQQLFPDESTLQIPALTKIPKNGMQSTYNGKKCVWVLSGFFDEFLENHGLASTPNVHHTMKDRGMLVYHTDRFKKNKGLGKSGEAICYCLLLGNTSTTSATKTSNLKKYSQINKLLSTEDSV